MNLRPSSTPTFRVAAYAAALLSAGAVFGTVLSGCGASDHTNSSTDSDTPTTPTPREWLPVGGNATAPFQEDLSFLQFIPGLDLGSLPTVSQGRELFVAEWTAAPGTRQLLDGLGPLFIANACSNCHLPSGRAASLNEDGTTAPGILFRLGTVDGTTDSHYGSQLQTSATVGSAEGSVSWTDIGHGQPHFQITQAGIDLDNGINLGARLSPQLTGMGLLQSVPESYILAWEDPLDTDQNGVSGKAHRIHREGAECLGRFGWKAMQCTLRGQSAGALNQDMGLTTPLNPSEPCTNQQTVCSEQPSGGEPEVSETALNAINDFLTALAVPERRINDQEQFDRGADLFEQIGCHLCHRPTLSTGHSTTFPQLSRQQIYAYTDLLLHDMGSALDDGVQEGSAESREWKTPPLWGLGLIEGQGDSRFLHDGRAKTLPEAIEWHGGEAASSRLAYDNLTDTEQTDLLIFLRGI